MVRGSNATWGNAVVSLCYPPNVTLMHTWTVRSRAYRFDNDQVITQSLYFTGTYVLYPDNNGKEISARVYDHRTLTPQSSNSSAPPLLSSVFVT